ncbi:hypothetical protein LTR62_008250 [Meristemomyces frigidus]|uniref:Uncharacterized protein n=1 Tax=Meristemomyces frigidus TaxID=1508187 RepID=A0AAN7TI82_9PEZI|nr:hypothetical protein LTR62_008250 [Meristemomyces frigidus]
MASEPTRDAWSHLIPEPFQNITWAWTYDDTRQAYPHVGEHDVYYHTFMSVQLFASQHPQFDYIWNWEMDVRYTGNYHKLMRSLATWSATQGDKALKRRNARFYIPSVHESYENFSRTVAEADQGEHDKTSKGSVWSDDTEADLITTFPIFDVEGTLWPHKNYIINYDKSNMPPRHATVGTNMRLSRRLLDEMDYENRQGRSMMSEMWPPTLAYQRKLKVVYVPIPVWLREQWPPEALESTFNGGRGSEVGGSLGSVINYEKVFKGSTWYWNAEFALDLYTRWLGLADDGPGSTEWEASNGPLCLPAMLLHPVKSERISSLN